MTIARRYAGPPSSGNGGYTSGLLAAFVRSAGQPVTVTLRRPPPLETLLDVVTYAGGAILTRLLNGDDRIAEAAAGVFTTRPGLAVSVSDALAAESAYRGLTGHPFDGCFVCGTGARRR